MNQRVATRSGILGTTWVRAAVAVLAITGCGRGGFAGGAGGLAAATPTALDGGADAGTALELRDVDDLSVSASAFAQCPPGSHVVGGGCSCLASPSSATPRLVGAHVDRTTPNAEGYRCSCAGVDVDGGQVPMTAAQATCLSAAGLVVAF